MWIVEVLYKAIIVGFLARQFARVFDNWMARTMVLGFIRYRIACWLKPEYMAEVVQTEPINYEQHNIYYQGVYEEVGKYHFWYRALNCQYCLSFWFMVLFSFLFAAQVEGLEAKILFYSLSIAFKDVFFKM